MFLPSFLIYLKSNRTAGNLVRLERLFKRTGSSRLAEEKNCKTRQLTRLWTNRGSDYEQSIPSATSHRAPRSLGRLWWKRGSKTVLCQERGQEDIWGHLPHMFSLRLCTWQCSNFHSWKEKLCQWQNWNTEGKLITLCASGFLGRCVIHMKWAWHNLTVIACLGSTCSFKVPGTVRKSRFEKETQTGTRKISGAKGEKGRHSFREPSAKLREADQDSFMHVKGTRGNSEWYFVAENFCRIEITLELELHWN